MKATGKVRQGYLTVMAVLGCLALAVQILLSVTRFNTDRSLLYALVDVFSYFTVLTNILVVVVVTASLLRRTATAFLTRPSTMSAVAVYILVVGVVYAFLLKARWQPTGLQRAADVALHEAIPTLYVLYWLLLVPKGTLRWIQPLYWLIYPAAYVAYSVARGALSGRYPYYFADVAVLGYPAVVINTAMLLVGFLAIGLIVIVIDDLGGRFRRSQGLQTST